MGRSSLAASFAIAAALVASACDGHHAPPFPEGQGQLPRTGAAYPSGPYGIQKGDTIPNFELTGFPAPLEDRKDGVPIALADFYNPGGDGTFPEDSIYGAGPKPKALLINVGAVWCQPCQYEADVLLPAQYEKYAPQGVEFLFVLADGTNPGVAANLTQLTNWTKKFDTAWPSTIDPDYAIGSLFKANAFPVNIVVDPETMEIVEVVAGLPEEDGPLFQALDDLVGG